MNTQLPNPILTAPAVVVIRDTVDQDDYRVRLASCEGFLPHKGLNVTIDDPCMSPGTELELLLDDQVIVRHIVTAAELHTPLTVQVGPENLTKDLHELNYRVKRNNQPFQTCDQPATVHIVIKSMTDLGLDEVTSRYRGSFARIHISYPQDEQYASPPTTLANEKIVLVQGLNSLVLDQVNPFLHFVAINRSEICAIDTRTGTIVRRHQTSFSGAKIGGLSPDGVYAYIHDRVNKNILKLNTVTGEAHDIAITIDIPREMVLSKSGERLYVATSSDLEVIDTPSQGVIRRLPIKNIIGLAIHPDGRHLYVFTLIGEGSTVYTWIHAYDTQSFEWVRRNLISGFVEGIAISPDGARLYVADEWNGKISLITTANHQTIKVSKSVRRPYRLGVSADGRHVYVTETDQTTIWVLDAESLDIVRVLEGGRFYIRALLGGPDDTIFALHLSADVTSVPDDHAGANPRLD
ncbi:hypothetical protein PS862_01707 [Pseudomonas fluorescens]|uniref:YncE family protein n=1 Tax=Pseudomonas fluorescens TaxID=294 RepID=A0A5E7IRP9_PSEFL|nr:hypothetical protein [Pseudomonas fluorescens]VVO78646.1 hypothetical protein PS862_01707 [Pseudomonas fluorescens]